MALVVIGGHSRSVGKTSVVAGLIEAMPERRWTAIKVTQYGHGVCSTNGEACGCAVDEHTFAITPEVDRSGNSDTSRFLVAGAERSIWVRTKQGRLAEAMPELRRILAEAENAIVESNSLMRFVRPDLYLTVLDYATEDFKPSAREFLDLASAVILHETAREGVAARWPNVSLKPVADKPKFYVRPPQYVTPEMVAFVRSRLASTAGLSK
jgi:molybdopterin-guanine dinucleotide biosynthesis protein